MSFEAPRYPDNFLVPSAEVLEVRVREREEVRLPLIAQVCGRLGAQRLFPLPDDLIPALDQERPRWTLSDEEEREIVKAAHCQDFMLMSYLLGNRDLRRYRAFMDQESIRGENQDVGLEPEDNIVKLEDGSLMLSSYWQGRRVHFLRLRPVERTTPEAMSHLNFYELRDWNGGNLILGRETRLKS